MTIVTTPKRPWWQTTHTPKAGFVLGGGWALLAALQWLTLVGSDPTGLGGRPGRIVVAAAFTMGAAAYLTTAVLLRRRGNRPDRPV